MCPPPVHASSKTAPSSLNGDATSSGSGSTRYLQSGDKERRNFAGRGASFLPEATVRNAEAGSASPLSPASSSPNFSLPPSATSSVSTTGEISAPPSGAKKVSEPLDTSCRASAATSGASATPMSAPSSGAFPVTSFPSFSSIPGTEKADASQFASALQGSHASPPGCPPSVDPIVLAEVLHGFDCVRGELFLNEEERQTIQHFLQPFNFRFVPVISRQTLAAGAGGRRGFSSKRSTCGTGPSRRLTQEVQRLQEAACSFAALPRGKRRQSKANSRYQDDDTGSAVGDKVGDSEQRSSEFGSVGPTGHSRSGDSVDGGAGSQYLSGGEFWMGPHGPHSAASPGSGGEKTVSVVSDDTSTVSRSSRAGKGEGRRAGGRRSRHQGGVGGDKSVWGSASGRGKGEDADHGDAVDDGRTATTVSGRGRKRKVRQERYDMLDDQGWDEDKEDHKLRRTSSRVGKGGETGPSSGASTAASGFERIVFTPILRSTPWRESSMLILQHLKRHSAARWFLAPVDPELDGVPGYFEVVSRPMDFGTIERKLRAGPRVYIHPSQWQQDVRQVFFNAFSFHPATHDVWQDAAVLAAEFERCCRQTDQVNPYFATLTSGGVQTDGSDRHAFSSNGHAEPSAAPEFAASTGARNAGGRWGGASAYAPFYGASASAPASQAIHENSWGSSSDVGADASHVSASVAGGRSGRGAGRARRQAPHPFETTAHVSDPYFGGGYGGAHAPGASGRGRGRGAAASGLASPRRGGRGRGRGAAAQLLQRCHTWGEMSSKGGPFLMGHQQGGGRGRGGGAVGAGFGPGMGPYGTGAQGVGPGAMPGAQTGLNAAVGVDPQQAYMELDAPPNAPVLPPPPVPRIGVNDKPLSASQKRVLEQNMTRLSSMQRKAALELIQDDLGILAAEYMDEKEFAFDTELLSIEKQKRLFAYVNSMVRANRELWRQQQEAASMADPNLRAHGGGGPVAMAGVSPYPPAFGGVVGDGAPVDVKGHQGKRGKKKQREERSSGQDRRRDDSDSSSSNSDSSCSSSSSSFSDSSSDSSSDSDDSDDTDDEKTDAAAAGKKQVRPSAVPGSGDHENASAKPNNEGFLASSKTEVNSSAAPGPGSSHQVAGHADASGLPSSGAGARDGAQLAGLSGKTGTDSSGRPGRGTISSFPTEAGPKAEAERDGSPPLLRGGGERIPADAAAEVRKDEATLPQDGRRDALDGMQRGGAEAMATDKAREEGRGVENASRLPASTAAVPVSAAGARSAGGLPQYTPVCEEEGSDEIREEVMGRHADFFGAFDSHPPGENSEETVGSQGVAATEAKPTAWKEWKGQVIQQGFVAQRAYAAQDRNVNEIIAEGYDARI